MTNQKHPTVGTPLQDRLSYLWLALGILLFAFAMPRWTIPLAAWLYPVFLLRFVRTQPLLRGFLLLLKPLNIRNRQRLNVAVVTDPDKDSKETLDRLSQLKGTELDVAFLKWLSDIHADGAVFEGEVKNGADADLKTYARNSIIAGNEHLKEARELLEKLNK